MRAQKKKKKIRSSPLWSGLSETERRKVDQVSNTSHIVRKEIKVSVIPPTSLRRKMHAVLHSYLPWAHIALLLTSSWPELLSSPLTISFLLPYLSNPSFTLHKGDLLRIMVLVCLPPPQCPSEASKPPNSIYAPWQVGEGALLSKVVPNFYPLPGSELHKSYISAILKLLPVIGSTQNLSN